MNGPTPTLYLAWPALTAYAKVAGSPHPQHLGVELQGASGVLDPHHRLLHDEVLAAGVRLGQVLRIVRERDLWLFLGRHCSWDTQSRAV